MPRQDPTLISFRLDREVIREIESRSDCPPSAGPGFGGASLWARRLVLRELGLDPDAGTSEATRGTVDEFLRAVTAYWRSHRVLTELLAEPDKKARSWKSKVDRAERHLAEVEHKLERFPRAFGHELGCDCDGCQKAASERPLG